jgi:hypothetical protein
LVSKSVISILEGAASDETNIYFPWDSTGLCVGEKASSLLETEKKSERERDLFAAGRKMRARRELEHLFFS